MNYWFIHGSSTFFVPKFLRERFCAIASDCLEGTFANDDAWAALAEAESKLLLYFVPYRMSLVVELERRLALWETRHLEELLLLIQLQVETGNKVLQDSAGPSATAGAAKLAPRPRKVPAPRQCRGYRMVSRL